MTLDSLVNAILRRRVIPVIGSELCMLTPTTKPSTHIKYVYDFLAEELAAKLEIDYTGQKLHVIAMDEKAKDQPIYTMLSDTYDDIEKEGKESHFRFLYAAFEKLAAMEELRIFLSVNFSNQLQEQLFRDRKENVQVIDFSLSQTADSLKILGKQEIKEDKTIVINLLGSIKSKYREFAVTEEEYLECFFHIISGAEGLFAISKSLLNKIKTCSFLYLGCSFPDWYARYIVRGLTQKRYLNHTFMGNIICDEYTPSVPSTRNFLAKYRSDIVDDVEMDSMLARNPDLRGNNRAETFINILYSNYQGRKADKLITGNVFICYYNLDREWAERIYEFLKTQNIDCWLDEADLPAGPHHEEIIEKIGQCRVFLPVISEALFNRMAEVESANRAGAGNPNFRKIESPYAVREEWKTIFARIRKDEHLKKTKQEEKIIPFIITTCITGEIKKDDERIPPDFRDEKAYFYPIERQRLADDIKAHFRNEKTAR